MPFNPRHQQLVSALLSYFRATLGFKILSASYGNYTPPEKYGRHSPDIVATDSNNTVHLAMAKESREEIFSEKTAEEFLDFSSRIMVNTNFPVPLHIIVYKENEADLLNRLKELGLSPLIGSKIKTWTI